MRAQASARVPTKALPPGAPPGAVPTKLPPKKWRLEDLISIDKLYAFGLHQNDVEQILTELITSGFLNEERYAKAFAGGKFRMKHWGKNKIENQLKFRGISKRCIQTGLKEIDDSDYRKELQRQLRKKSESTTETNIFKKRDKVARFAIGKGYEPELVWTYVMDLMPD